MAPRIQLASRSYPEYAMTIARNDAQAEERNRRAKDDEVKTQIVNPFEIGYQKVQRRDRVQILLKMLQSAKVPIRKTHLMYGAGINFYQLEKHLAFLQGSGMIEEVIQEDDTVAYRTTEKGRLFYDLFA